MPGQMNRNTCCVHPCRFGRHKKFKPLSGTPLHLHEMRDDMNGAEMSRIDRERASRHLFSAAILPILFEAESIHRKNACVAGNSSVPFVQHLCDAISQHTPLAEAEVERMSDDKRENIAWTVDKDGAVTFDRKVLIAVKPSARCGRVAARRIVGVRAKRFDCGYTFHKL